MIICETRQVTVQQVLLTLSRYHCWWHVWCVATQLPVGMQSHVGRSNLDLEVDTTIVTTSTIVYIIPLADFAD